MCCLSETYPKWTCITHQFCSSLFLNTSHKELFWTRTQLNSTEWNGAPAPPKIQLSLWSKKWWESWVCRVRDYPLLLWRSLEEDMCSGDVLFISSLQGILQMTGPVWSERALGFALMSLRDREPDRSLGRGGQLPGHTRWSDWCMSGNHMGGGRAGVSASHHATKWGNTTWWTNNLQKNKYFTHTELTSECRLA